MQSTYSKVKNVAAALAIASVAVGSAAIAVPAFADVTGYQTGYSYHEGLANGDGGILMSQAGGSANSDAVSANQYTAPAAPVSTSDTNAPTQSVTAVPAVQPAVVAPAVQPAAPAAVAAAPAPSIFASLSPVTWGIIALIVLAIIVGIAMILSEPAQRRTVTTTRTYQRYS